jgi:hypothetical protein
MFKVYYICMYRNITMKPYTVQCANKNVEKFLLYFLLFFKWLLTIYILTYQIQFQIYSRLIPVIETLVLYNYNPPWHYGAIVWT